MNLKNIFVPILISLCSIAACSSAPPKPEAPPVEQPQPVQEPEKEVVTIPAFYDHDVEIKTVKTQGDTTEYKVGDLMVIHRSTPGNDVVNARLTIVGGTQDYSPEQAGIEKLALILAATGGTKSTDRKNFNAQLEATGSSISTFASEDWSGYLLQTTTKSFDSTWKLFQQVIFEPLMPEGEFEKAQSQQIAAIRSRNDNPDAVVSDEITRLLYQNHPYSNLQIGTEKSVAALTRDDLAKFQQHQLDSSKMILSVVGNVPSDQLLGLIKQLLGKLKGSGESVPTLPTVTSKPDSAKVMSKPLPTHYIFAETVAPDATSPDFYPFIVANTYLNHKLFEEIRTKRNLTYAVSSGIDVGRASAAYLYVTAVKPTETLDEMYKVMKALKSKQISQQELTETVNTYITNIYMGLETNGAQASLLTSNQILKGDWRLADKIIDNLRAVTPEQVLKTANKYMKGYRFAILGPSKTLPDTLFDSTKATEPDTK